jgi:flagellar FliJ protein
MDYRFKLEALRKYRKFQEETLQKELAEAQRLRDREADILTELIDLQNKTESDLELKQKESASGPCLAIYSNYLNTLASDIFAQKYKLADAEKQLEKRRKVLLAAMQKRKTLDKLKEKGLKAHLESLNNEDQKFINEMAISRFSIKQR